MREHAYAGWRPRLKIRDVTTPGGFHLLGRSSNDAA
jgi:hypothetical protein